VIINGEPDYESIEDCVIFRIFNHEDKFIVKAKYVDLLLIHYGDRSSVAKQHRDGSDILIIKHEYVSRDCYYIYRLFPNSLPMGIKLINYGFYNLGISNKEKA
jgi:hypothetical protein